MSGGELSHHLQILGTFEESIACFYAAQILLAIEHLHKNKIMYIYKGTNNLIYTFFNNNNFPNKKNIKNTPV